MEDIIRKLSQRKELLAAIVALATIVPCCLAICAFIGITQLGDLLPRGLGAPSDGTVRNLIEPNYPRDVFGNKLRNFDVRSKHKCETISDYSTGRGIEQAWLVRYTYDYYCDGMGCIGGPKWVSLDYTGLIVRRDGDWEELAGMTCP
jgi:hypothetical protein